MDALSARPFAGRKVLIVGIANEHSIAYGCAKAFRELGADPAMTYLNDKARTYVEPLAQALGASIFLPLDVSTTGELEEVFETIRATRGRLDVAVHSIASSWLVLNNIRDRLHRMYWHCCRLSVQVLSCPDVSIAARRSR